MRPGAREEQVARIDRVTDLIEQDLDGRRLRLERAAARTNAAHLVDLRPVRGGTHAHDHDGTSDDVHEVTND